MQHVPADGRLDAPIVLIGESPGTHEKAEGKPFVGPSGHRLSKWWADVGLSRSDIYITNVVPYFYGPTTESLSQVPDLRPHFASLVGELSRLTNPKVIVPCGNLALAALWQTGLFKLFEGKPKLPEAPVAGSCPICAAPPGGPCKRKNGYKANPKTKRHAPDAIPALSTKPVKLPKYKPITASTAKQAASISNWRGSILPFHMPNGRLVKLIPTLHPAATLHAPTLEGCCRHDWSRIASEAATPNFVLPARRHVIRPTLADLDHFASAWWSALVSSPSTSYLVADLETTRPGQRHHPRIKCVGLSFDPSWSLVVPWGEHYWGSRWPTVYRWLKLLLEYAGGSRVVFHNGLFDTFWLAGEGVHLPQWWLDTLALHHCDDPADAHDLAYIASILTREPYWKDPGDSLEELWLYCGTDACVTREILDPLLDKLRRDGRLDFYRQYYAALFAPLLRLSREGMPVDNERRERVAVALKVKQVELKAALLDGAGQDTLFGGRGGLSNKKLLVYLNKRNLPTQYNRKTGRPTADETAIRNLMRKFPEQAKDLGQRILDLRETAKTLEFLSEERVDEDGHFRSSFAPFAESCRLRSSANAYGTGCLLPTAEVLTPEGWVSLEKWSGQKIMQWAPSGELTFCTPTMNTGPFDGRMVVARSWFHRQVYTPDHRIPITKWGQSTHKVITAQDAANRRVVLLPIAGQYSLGRRGDPNFMRLLVAVQADCYFEDGAIRASFKKKRKVVRFRALCSAMDISFTEYLQRKPDGIYHRFRLSAEDAAPYLALLGKHKQFGAWLLDFDQESLAAFVDEAAYWDGSRRGRSYVYSSVVQANAEWLATIAHLCRRSASVSVHDNKRGYGLHGNPKPLWRVAVKPRTYAVVEQKHWSQESYKGAVYCPTTETGFFLVRNEGIITVTGNSNAQNIPTRAIDIADEHFDVRSIFVPRPGCVWIEVDLSRIEDRLVKMLTKAARLIAQACLPPDQGDVHRQAAAEVFGIRLEDVTKQQRDLGKRVTHAGNYGMGEYTFHDNLVDEGIFMPIPECRRLLKARADANPEVGDWQMRTRIEVNEYRYLTGIFGHIWRVPWERMEGDLFRRAYAFRPQNGAATLLNQRGFVPLDAAIEAGLFPGAKLCNNIHDAVLVSAPAAVAYNVAAFLMEHLEQPLEVCGAPLAVYAELKVGHSWAKSDCTEFKRLPSRDVFEAAVAQHLEARR